MTSSLSCEPGTSGGGGSSSVSETESESTQAGATSTGSEPSLLDRLKAPMRSELTRKCVIRKNLSASLDHGNVSKKRPCCSTNPKSVTPITRVREFPDEHLRVYAGVLFCGLCREELSTKRSIIANHVASAKHKRGKLKLGKRESRQKNIAEALAKYDKQEHPRGETLSQDQRLYRINVVTAFLKAGVPLAKIDHFRDILEEHAYRLSDRRGMSDLIPFILSEQIKKEISGKPVSIIFDGTSRLGEALVIVLRFLDNWEIKQRLVQLQILVKSMTGEELAREILGVLCREYKLSTEQQ